MVRFALAAVLAGIVGCGQRSDPAAAADMGRAPTEHPALWSIHSNGGAVQAAPEIYTVVWQGSEPLGQQVADFLDWMLQSDYWTGSLAEYGVGAGRSRGVVTIPSPPPAQLSDADLQATVQQLVASGAVPSPGPNTQLTFLIPPATAVRAFGGDGCVVFAGYHQSIAVGAGDVSYSVIMQCEPPVAGDIDEITETLSHEAAEAATDPQPPSGFVAAGPVAQEVADLCVGAARPIAVPADATHAARKYWVQRLYSGQVAALGTADPCLPLPWQRPYWNVALDPAVVTAAAALGAHLTARLDVFAYGDVGEIKWFVGSNDGRVTATPSFGVAHAGDTIPVTLEIAEPKRDVYEVDLFAESQEAGSNLWISYVVLQ
jgi:hypothetical protein